MDNSAHYSALIKEIEMQVGKYIPLMALKLMQCKMFIMNMQLFYY